jgi:hypothetical protein
MDELPVALLGSPPGIPFPRWAFATVQEFGKERLLRIIAAAVVSIAAIQALPVRLAPDVAFVDPYTYFTAGARLNAGHRLYEIGPGDDPMHQGQTRLVLYPLLSPPPVGVIARPFAALGETGIVAWWAIIVVGAMAATSWFIASGRWPTLLVVILLAIPLGHLIWLGNLNGLLLGLLPMVWLTRRSPILAGTLVGIAAAVKLTPIILLVWLAVAVGRRAVVACLVTLAVALGLSLVGAGPDNMLAYVEVVRDTAAHGFTPSSATAVVRSAAGAPLFLVLAGGLILALRRRPQMGFAIGIFGTIWGGPIVYFHTLPLLLAALAPYGRGHSSLGIRGVPRPPRLYVRASIGQDGDPP